MSGVRPSSGAATSAGKPALEGSNVLANSRLAAPENGRTPAEQSRRTRPRLLARLNVLLAALGAYFFCFGAAAQTNAPVTQPNVPSAQTNTAVAQPNAPAAAEPKFAVTNFVVRGNTLLKKALVEEILAEAKGTNVTLTQIRKALGNLQNAYRERGWATVAVTLPQQKLTNETVIVQVTQAP